MFALANGVKFVPVHRGINVFSSTDTLLTEFSQPNMLGCDHQIKVGNHDIGLESVHHLAEVTPDVMSLWLKTISENIGAYLKDGVITPHATLGGITLSSVGDDTIKLSRLGETLVLTDTGSDNFETFLNYEDDFAFLTYRISDGRRTVPAAFIYRIDTPVSVPNDTSREDYYRPWLLTALASLGDSEIELDIVNLRIGKITTAMKVQGTCILIDEEVIVHSGREVVMFGSDDVQINSLDGGAVRAFLRRESKIPVSYCLPEFFTPDNVGQAVKQYMDNPDAHYVGPLPDHLRTEIVNCVMYDALSCLENLWIGEVIAAMGRRNYMAYSQLNELVSRKLTDKYNTLIKNVEVAELMKHVMAVQSVVMSWYTQK